jgi:hypothetical protein
LNENFGGILLLAGILNLNRQQKRSWNFFDFPKKKFVIRAPSISTLLVCNEQTRTKKDDVRAGQQWGQ